MGSSQQTKDRNAARDDLIFQATTDPFGSGFFPKPPELPSFDREFNTQGVLRKEIGDGSAFAALQQEGLRQGPSRFAQNQLAQQRIGQSQGLEQLRNQSATSAAQAEGRLAAGGGLSSGARERLAGQSAFASLAGQQGIRQQGELQRLGIQGQDEQNRLNILGQLPGLANQRAGLFAQAAGFDANALLQQDQIGAAARNERFSTIGDIKGAQLEALLNAKF